MKVQSEPAFGLFKAPDGYWPDILMVCFTVTLHLRCSMQHHLRQRGSTSHSDVGAPTR